jgi:hypothetical protein
MHLEKGSYFGEISLLLNLKNQMLYITDPDVLKTELLSIEASLFLNLMKEYPHI